jgi:hypothetical protein
MPSLKLTGAYSLQKTERLDSVSPSAHKLTKTVGRRQKAVGSAQLAVGSVQKNQKGSKDFCVSLLPLF